MALDFDERGLLPPGIHDATRCEISDAFGRMQRSDTRIKLFANLETWLGYLDRTGWEGAEVILDGSFVMTNVDEPGDIDIILVLPNGRDPADPSFTLAERRVLDKSFTKELKIEVKSVRPCSPEYQDWTEFFAQVRDHWCHVFGWPEGISKGLVRLVP